MALTGLKSRNSCFSAVPASIQSSRPQPLKEEHLLSGPLEPTNQWYAIAKIAGIKLCQAYRRQYGCDFICAMPTNMYGPNDNYDLQTSHVLPALIRKFHEAKVTNAPTITCWGTGAPFREFLYADDLAQACLFLMQNYSDEQIINVGYGSDVTMRELAETVKRIVGFKGEIVWDKSKPDGTPRKLMDSSRLFALGWKPRIDLEAGIRLAYQDFQSKFTAPRNPLSQHTRASEKTIAASVTNFDFALPMFPQ